MKKILCFVLVLVLGASVWGCKSSDLKDDDSDNMSFPTGTLATKTDPSTAPVSSEQTSSEESEATTVPSVDPELPVAVSVPAAGVNFELPAGWSLVKATRYIHTFLGPDGETFLNVFIGVGSVARVATGQEGLIYEFVDRNLYQMPAYYDGFEGWGSSLELSASNASKFENAFTEGKDDRDAYRMDATLSVGMQDEYGQLVTCPDLPSVFYSYPIDESCTAVAFLLSTTPDNDIDLNAIIDRIIASSTPYTQTLADLNIAEYTTFKFDDLGVSFELPQGFEALTIDGNTRIAIPSNASNPLNDFQVHVYGGYDFVPGPATDAEMVESIMSYLTEVSFYQMFFDPYSSLPQGSEDIQPMHTEQGKPYGLFVKDQAGFFGYRFSWQAPTTMTGRDTVVDNGYPKFYGIEFLNTVNGETFLMTITYPQNEEALAMSLIAHMNETLNFYS